MIALQTTRTIVLTFFAQERFEPLELYLVIRFMRFFIFA